MRPYDAEHDLVKDALEGVGMSVEFWRVKMRPGSPFSFGIIQRDGAAPLPVFGLPGNPVSAVVTFELHFLRVALARGPMGVREATLTGPQGSGILTSVARADALLVVPLDVTEIPAGGHAAAVLLQAGDDAQDTLGF